MRILLTLAIVLSATACSEAAPAPEQPAEQVAQQAAVPAEPQLPGMSELKGALIGSCPKIAMRLADASCSEAGEEGDEFACTFKLVQDEAEHSATIASEGEDWKLVDAPEECSAAA